MPVGSTLVVGGDEVIRIRDVALPDSATVHPGIPRGAAGEKPAVPHRRVPNGEARKPPGLRLRFLVDLCVRHPRLAVANVPDDDGLGLELPRRSEPDHDLVAGFERRSTR